MLQMDQERLVNIAKTGVKTAVLLGVVGQIAMMRFPRGVRNVIIARANRLSEVTHRQDRPLECSHINHARNTGYYANPLNGVYMTDEEHLVYHEYFTDNPLPIGLTRDQNDWAVDKIKERVDQFNILHERRPMSERSAMELIDIMMQIVGDKCLRLGSPNPFEP